MPKNRWLLASALAVFACGVSRAEEDRWEFGPQSGVFIPLHKRTFQHDIPNNVVVGILQGETIADEVGEGFIMPSLAGASRISGTMRPTTDVGGRLYYHLRPDLQVGLEGGFALRRSAFIDSRGIFDLQKDRGLHMSYQDTAVHVTPMVKLGRWWHFLRPNVALGPGLYFFRETIQGIFIDTDDAFQSLHTLYQRTHTFTGFAAAAGVDVKLGKRGALGLSCQYDKVFGAHGSLDFLLPKGDLSVYFGGDSSWF